MRLCAAPTLGRAVLVVALASSASAAAAGDTQDQRERRKQAQTLFAQAVKLAEAGDSRAALAAFRGAYEKYPSFRVLFNIGQLCGRLGDAACAVRAYEKYLRDGGADVPAKRREAVESELRGLTRTIATVTVKSNVAGAEVVLDDVSVGRTPIAEPIPVNAGSHKVVFSHEGKTIEKTFKVVSGDAPTVELDVEKEAPPAPAAAPAPRERDTPDEKPRTAERAPRKFPVVPWAVTGGFAVATAVTGVLAATSYATYQDKRDSFPVTREELDDAQGAARDLLLLTGLFGTITVVSAGVAGYFTFLAPAAQPAASAGAKPGVAFAAGPRGVVVSGVLP